MVVKASPRAGNAAQKTILSMRNPWGRVDSWTDPGILTTCSCRRSIRSTRGHSCVITFKEQSVAATHAREWSRQPR